MLASHMVRYILVKKQAIGKIGCFSFYTSKNMTTGEGGMVVTNDKNIYKKLLSLKSHGNPNENSPYLYNGIGHNYSMTTMQAIIGLVQLKKLNILNRYREEIFKIYLKEFNNLPLILPRIEKNIISAHHLFPILIPEKLKSKRDQIVEALKSEGVPLCIAYPKPMYDAPQFSKYHNFACPNAENVSSRIITFFTDKNIPKTLIPKIKIAMEKILNYFLKK